MRDYAKIWTVINTPAYSSLSDKAAAARGRDKTVIHYRLLSSAESLAWCGAEGRRARLDEATVYDTTVEGEELVAAQALASVARTAVGMFGLDGAVLDLNLPERVGMLDALVAAGVFTAADKTSLMNAAKEMVSPFEAAGLGNNIYEGHVGIARAQFTPA